MGRRTRDFVTRMYDNCAARHFTARGIHLPLREQRPRVCWALARAMDATNLSRASGAARPGADLHMHPERRIQRHVLSQTWSTHAV